MSSPPQEHESVELPRSTASPFVLAVGLTMAVTGLVTNLAMSVLGVLLAAWALFAWIRQLLPGVGHEHVAWVPADQRPQPVVASRIPVVPLKPGMPGHRARLPEKVHPYSAGATGGLIGGVAMAVVALTYGVVSVHGIWWPINLLAGMVWRSAAIEPEKFHLTGLIVATLIHGLMSLGVGLFFGVLLPTLPRWPIFWGGVVGPLLWTGAIYSFMGVLNPALNRQVDWPWFVASQFAYGLVAGIVVTRSEMVYAEKAQREGPRDSEVRP
jgi:hypothetical protein